MLGLTACGQRSEAPMSPFDGELTVLDYNIWHGLNPRGLARFEEFETPEVREKRLTHFLAQARRLDPDVVFLQEVNPAPALSRRIARELGMDAVWSLDNTGLKVLGYGPPTNFYSGLAILAKKGLGLRERGEKTLSGPFRIASRLLCFQTAENRGALAAEVRLGDRHVLLVNTHLHHGPEVTPEIRGAIEALAEKGMIPKTRPAEVFAIIEQSEWRRQEELNVAMEWMRKMGADSMPVLFAGDFNASPDAPELRWLKLDQGFASATDDEGPELFMTWDHERNRNTDTLKGFEPVHRFEPPVMDVLQKILEEETRRLDYIFHRGFARLGVERSGIFGDVPDAEGRMASDHFGVYAVLRIGGH